MKARSCFQRLVLAGVLAMAGTAQAQGVLTVEVFANSAMHITPVPAQGQALPYKLSVYRLDALQRIETTLNQ